MKKSEPKTLLLVTGGRLTKKQIDGFIEQCIKTLHCRRCKRPIYRWYHRLWHRIVCGRADWPKLITMDVETSSLRYEWRD